MCQNHIQKIDFEKEISELSHIERPDFSKKSSDFFKLLQISYDQIDIEHKELAGIVEKAKTNKLAFLSLSTYLILIGSKKESRRLLGCYKDRFGSRFIVALELNLKLILKTILSPRGGGSQNDIADIKGKLTENIEQALEIIQSENKLNQVLENFVKNIFDFRNGSKEQAKARFIRHLFIGRNPDNRLDSLAIGILIDDLNPNKTSTLTKMVFDLCAVICEYTNHNIIIINSRLHTPDDSFWHPGVHQTRKFPLKVFLKHYDIDERLVKNRIKVINLNESFYGKGKPKSITLDVIISYPFRHKILEPIFYDLCPCVEVEIMTGKSMVQYADVVVPNGVPSEPFLKENYRKVAIIVPARRKFKGIDATELPYLKGAGKLIVSASKDFDKRSHLNIETFLGHIAHFLKENKEFSWVFIGGTDDLKKLLETKYHELINEKKMIYVRFESDLPQLMLQSYLYIQPPMIGGGRMPAIAIENNCPFLTFNFGDCTKYVPIECQSNSFEQLFFMISTIAQSDAKRKELISKCMAAIALNVNEESAIGFVAALKRAIVKYQTRSLQV